jgi:Plasmid rolling circle replication initiator protein and truncated derivatives
MGFFKQVKDITPRVGNQVESLRKESAKKEKSARLEKSLMRLQYEGKAERVKSCGTLFAYAYIFSEDRLVMHRANFCRERLCPMCALQKTRQVYAKVSRVMDVIEAERPELTPLFLTLTVRNCKAEELTGTLDMMFRSWGRVTNNKRVKRLVPGFFRSLEVTYNEESDTYHPHIHAILLVPPNYFTNPKDYMPTQRWVATWRKAMRLDYDPVCDIRAIGSGEGQQSRADAVAEVAKYTVKDTDYLKDDDALTDNLVQVFGAALKGRRLYAFGGLMKEVAKRLKLQDLDELEPGNVTDENGKVLRKDIDYVLIFYRWSQERSRYECEGPDVEWYKEAYEKHKTDSG